MMALLSIFILLIPVVVLIAVFVNGSRGITIPIMIGGVVITFFLLNNTGDLTSQGDNSLSCVISGICLTSNITTQEAEFDCKGCLDNVESINKKCEDRVYYVYLPSDKKDKYDKCIAESNSTEYNVCLSMCQSEWKRRQEQR